MNSKTLASSSTTVALLLTSSLAFASSHAEAPGTARDPAADLLDFYMFRSPENLNTITMAVTAWPFQEPGGGPNYPAFDDDVRYNIEIDSNGDAREDIRYEFTFRTEYSIGNQSYQYARGIRSLNPPDIDWYVRQRVTVFHVDVEPNTRTMLLDDALVAPHNIGAISPNYGALAQAAVRDVTVPDPGGGAGRIFVGPRDDPFFGDVGQVHDGFAIRPGAPGNVGGGVDMLSGYNVLAIVIQVPIRSVTLNRNQPTQTGTDSIVGAWATAERRRITIRAGGATRSHGQWEQVSRVGIPLINTMFTPIELKDQYNATEPRDDLTSATFTNELTATDIAAELSLVYPLDYTPPPQPRMDLLALVAGHPHLGEPLDSRPYLLQPADMIRLDVTLSASPLDGTSNRMGLLAAQNGFPQGRRLDDDVVDIMLRLASGILLGPPFNAALNGTIGDGADQNDVPFANSFPYLAPPHPGSAQGGHSMPAARPE